MSRPETVEVPTALLDTLAALDTVRTLTDHRQFASAATVERLIALRPAPNWEPTEEQVMAYLNEGGGDARRYPASVAAIRDLKAAVKALGVDQS